MALQDLVRERIKDNSSPLAIWSKAEGNIPLEAVKQAVKDLGIQAVVYDFSRLSPCGDIPELSLDGKEVLFINRIDKAPPAFIAELSRVVCGSLNGRHPAIIVSTMGRSSGMSMTLEAKFTHIKIAA